MTVALYAIGACLLFIAGYLLALFEKHIDPKQDYICKNCKHYDGKICGQNGQMRADGHRGCELFKYKFCSSECTNCILCSEEPNVKDVCKATFSCRIFN